MPSFALADDGVLIEHRGKILAASDWIPQDTSITSLTAEKGLCIRYPIRMLEDLLPVRHLTQDELVPMLKEALGAPDLDDTLITYILERQLRMEGTYILHSKTASRNGGDFDFDTNRIQLAPDLRPDAVGRAGLALGERGLASWGVRAGGPKRWHYQRIPPPAVVPCLHLCKQCRSCSHFIARPSRLERISELERKLNFTMRPGASLVQIVQAHRRNRADEVRQQSFCFR